MKNFLLLSAALILVLISSNCEKDDCTAPSPDTNNTELVKKLFGYFGAGDVQSYLNGHDANCVFDLTGNQILNPGKVYNGHAGFMQFLADLSAKGQPTVINPVDFYESGDVVTVRGNLTFTDFSTGKSCNVNFVQIWEFNSAGQVVAFKEDHDNRVCQ